MITWQRTDWDSIQGTSLQGYVETTYFDLVNTFGEPDGGSDKTTAEWLLDIYDHETKTRIFLTIYDWKVDTTPLLMYQWHIGASKPGDVYILGKIFGKAHKLWSTRL